MFAAGNGHEAVVKILIDRGASLEMKEFVSCCDMTLTLHFFKFVC